MSFVLYQNKSSLDQPNCRLVRGGTAELDGNFVGYWTKLNLPRDPVTDQKFTITKDFEFRADKISYVLYGTDYYQWLVLEYNNIVDIIEELAVGNVLIVPSYNRTLYNLVSS